MPFCRHCGAKHESGTRFCQQCGSPLEGPAAYHITPSVREITASTLPRKDPGIVALIADLGDLFLFGLEHFYVGKIGRGIAFLIVGIIVKIVLIIFFVGGVMSMFFGRGGLFDVFSIVGLLNLGLWMWQIADPDALAKRYNAEVERTGGPPW